MYLFKVFAAAAVFSLANSARTITHVSITAPLPNATFQAHLHDSPCEYPVSGGGHYKHDTTISQAVEPNENWPILTCASGVCTGTDHNPWPTRPEALHAGLSIVIHDTPSATLENPAGPKMLCADLVRESAGVYGGTFAYVNGSAAEYNRTITKSYAKLTTLGFDAQIEFTLGNAEGNYSAHLHNGNCNESSPDGLGGHYNTYHSYGDETNVFESWPHATCVGNTCFGEDVDDWQPTEQEFKDGLSIVVHDTPNGGAKMLCAELEYISPGVYGGEFEVLDSYVQSGGNTTLACAGQAIVAKSVTATSIYFAKRSFGDNTYKSHLHNAPCGAPTFGGGHYVGGYDDVSPADAVEENWPEVTCDDGICSGSAVNDWLIPQADFDEPGLAIVIHDTPNADSGSGQKMFCSNISSNGKYGLYDGTRLALNENQYTGNETAPRRSSVSVVQTSAGNSGNFANYASKSSKGSKGSKSGCKAGKGAKGSKSGKNKGSKSGKSSGLVSFLNVASSAGGSMSIGIVSGLLVVAAAVFVVKRRKEEKLPGMEVFEKDVDETTPLTI